METSIFLAKVMGLISAVSAASVLIQYKESLTYEEGAAKSPAMVYTSGFVILILGALVVVGHSVWTLDWRLVITLLGWALLLKGVGRIFFPHAVKRMIERKRNNRKFLFGEAAVLLVGLYLLYYDFIVY